MKTIRFDKTEGKRLRVVYDCDRAWREWRVYKTSARLPDHDHLFNFDLVASGGKDSLSLLVLDPYGDESLDSSIRKRMGLGPVCSQPLAIDRKTGHILLTCFYKEKDAYTMSFSRFAGISHGRKTDDYVVPKHYLSRLDELKSKKRPFDVSALPSALASFIDRSIGFGELSTALTVRLDFDKTNVEVWGESYREVSDWKDWNRR